MSGYWIPNWLDKWKLSFRHTLLKLEKFQYRSRIFQLASLLILGWIPILDIYNLLWNRSATTYPLLFLRHYIFQDWESSSLIRLDWKINLEHVKIDLMIDPYYVSLFLSKYIQILIKKIFESLLRWITSKVKNFRRLIRVHWDDFHLPYRCRLGVRFCHAGPNCHRLSPFLLSPLMRCSRLGVS